MAYKGTGRPPGRPKLTEEQKIKARKRRTMQMRKYRKAAKPKKPAGRPAYEPTEEQREKVIRYVGAGISQQEIANILGIAYNTLDKYFRFELDTGASICHAKAVDLLWDSAKNGNVSAQKALVEKANINSAVATVRQRGKMKEINEPAEPKVRAPQLGKRQQEVIDAEQAASGIYAIPDVPKPRLAVNNS